MRRQLLIPRFEYTVNGQCWYVGMHNRSRAPETTCPIVNNIIIIIIYVREPDVKQARTNNRIGLERCAPKTVVRKYVLFIFIYIYICLGSDYKYIYINCLSSGTRLGPTSPLEAPGRRRRVLAIYASYLYLYIYKYI